jgi:hypothetical protein
MDIAGNSASTSTSAPLARGASHVVTVGEVVKSLDGVSPQDHLRDGRWLCEQLESGNILFFGHSPFVLSASDREFLLMQRQTGAGYHKNIAYRPVEDRLTGLEKGVPAADAQLLRSILRSYSDQAEALLGKMFPPYAGRWKRDFASFRAVEERGRKMRQRARNDLPHTDAFPTRPTNGDRILRVFTNLNPSQSRIWITSDNFEVLAERYAPLAGLPQRARPPLVRWLKGVARAAGLPVPDRSPYDAFMLRFHNFLKENSEFQQHCRKDRWEFPPGSSWMVYTDMVSHAVLEGQFAMEQTFLVSREAMVTPERSPIGVLERLCGCPLSRPQ